MILFTPLQEGRPVNLEIWHHVAEVSIHAPARGATWFSQDFSPLKKVSIHAPERGATKLYVGTDAPYGVSIHDPAKGAT